MNNSNVLETKSQDCELLGVDDKEILSISAKSGEGVENLFNEILTRIPPPEKQSNDKLKALIFDSYFDQYRGVVVYVKIVSGSINKGMSIKFFKYDDICEVIDVGILELKKKSVDVCNIQENKLKFLFSNQLINLFFLIVFSLFQCSLLSNL